MSSNQPIARDGNYSPHDGERSAITQQAAAWFGRREVGLPPAEELAFVRWLDADERHRDAYREIVRTWDFLDGMKELERLSRLALENPVRGASAPPFRRRRVALFPVVFAVAAAIAIMFVIFERRPGADAQVVRQASTDSDDMKKLELPDGSVVNLNASSAVEIEFTAAERRVRLVRGEAHFTVAKNPSRPFVVRAGGASVKAVGTAFNVRLGAHSVEVLVTEGKVAVGPSVAVSAGEGSTVQNVIETGGRGSVALVESPVIGAGQRAIVSLSAGAMPSAVVVEPITGDEIERALAWQVRPLEFDETPLNDIVAQFNRYNHHQLVIVDAELAKRRFGGTFRADKYEVFVQLLESRFGVVGERSGDKTLLRSSRVSPNPGK